MHLVTSHQSGIYRHQIPLYNLGGKKERNAINLNSIFSLPIIPINELIDYYVNMR